MNIHAPGPLLNHTRPVPFDPAAGPAAKTREAAKGLVSSAFLVPMLASIRESSRAAGPFAPTVSEKRFGPILDQQIADQVMKGTRFALVDAIVDRYAKEEQQ